MNDSYALQGVIAPLFTPVFEDRTLDLSGARSLVGHLVRSGSVDALFARSGVGCMWTFTMAETRRFARAVLAESAGALPVLVGCAGEWPDFANGRRPPAARYIDQAVDLTAFAAEEGAAAAVHVVPFAPVAEGGQDPADAICCYFDAVTGSATLPIVIYQPGSTPVEYRLTPDILRRVAAMPRMAGMKVTTSDGGYFQSLASAVSSPGFSLICGDERRYLDSLSRGARGVIGEGCNVYPEVLRAVGQRYRAGNRRSATAAQAAVNALLDAKPAGSGISAWKQVLRLQGVDVQQVDRGGAGGCTVEEAEALSARVIAERDRWRSGGPGATSAG